jgi:hypothetical protein
MDIRTDGPKVTASMDEVCTDLMHAESVNYDTMWFGKTDSARRSVLGEGSRGGINRELRPSERPTGDLDVFLSASP